MLVLDVQPVETLERKVSKVYEPAGNGAGAPCDEGADSDELWRSMLVLLLIFRGAVSTYLEVPFDLDNPTPRPTARATMTASTIEVMMQSLVHPPRFVTCLLFLKSENFSPLGPVMSLYSG